MRMHVPHDYGHLVPVYSQGVSNPLELELWIVMRHRWVLDFDSSLLQKQHAFVTAEPSLQP